MTFGIFEDEDERILELMMKEINMSNVIEVQNLYKSYKDFSLNNVSFSLPIGYIMGFVGQNGAGKTTTIRIWRKSPIISP